jgi:hypothetical protein
MEKSFVDVLQSLSKESGVVGAVVADSNGLCLGHTGACKFSPILKNLLCFFLTDFSESRDNNSGYVRALATDAAQLTGSSDFILCVETSHRQIMVKNMDQTSSLAGTDVVFIYVKISFSSSF